MGTHFLDTLLDSFRISAPNIRLCYSPRGVYLFQSSGAPSLLHFGTKQPSNAISTRSCYSACTLGKYVYLPGKAASPVTEILWTN